MDCKKLSHMNYAWPVNNENRHVPAATQQAEWKTTTKRNASTGRITSVTFLKPKMVDCQNLAKTKRVGETKTNRGPRGVKENGGSGRAYR
jgi:hypothetical protein